MPATPPRKVSAPRRVVVIGGGIAGLAAAWELTGGAGERSTGSTDTQVVVLEASDRLGGPLRTEAFGDLMVDVGPDGFVGRRPEGSDLCREAGLGGDLVPVGATGACIWARGKQRELPTTMLGVPTRFWPVARSRVLGPKGSLRLLADQVAPRPSRRGALGDRALGPLVARKLGQSVVDTLIDPLIGGIHAGSVADMSTAALFPLLLAAAQGRGGLMRALHRVERRETGDEKPPAFWSLRAGMGSLTDGIADALERRGVEVRTGCAVVEIVRASSGAGWALETGRGPFEADALVIAAPAHAAAELLAPHDSDAATLLRGIEYASVALVTLSYPEDAFARPLKGTGMLVPRSSPTPAGIRSDGGLLVTACSYLSRKWPHLAFSGQELLRASLGRFGDDRSQELSDSQIIERVTDEMKVLVGVRGDPHLAKVTRWPLSFPQYRVHHLLRVAGIESAVERLPALAVAGSSYRGVGIPACIGSGRQAARRILEALNEQSGRPRSPQPVEPPRT